MSHSAENFVGCAFQKFPVAKSLWIKGGGEGVSRCSVENFLSHSAENFRRGESFSVSLNFGYRKSLDKRGEYQDFLSNFFVSQYQKYPKGNPLVSH